MNNATTHTKPKKRTQGSKWIRPEKRLAIYLRDEFRCVYCGRNLHGASNAEVTLDHLKCYSEGGSNSETNLITACRSCNSARGSRSIRVWADEATRKTIRRNTRRKLGRYLEQAKALIKGEAGSPELECK